MKNYLQILSTEASFYICDRPLTDSDCWSLCVECADKILIFAVLKWWLLQQTETESIIFVDILNIKSVSTNFEIPYENYIC